MMSSSSESFEFTTWPQVLEALTRKAKQDGVLNGVKKAADFEGMIRAAQDIPGVRRRLARWISQCSESHYRKSGGAATKLRDEGNIKFKAGDITGSLKLYNESVVCAPEFGPELSLAFGNRSACLYHLGLVKECLEDIALALSLKFPKDLAFKLYQRRGICLIKLLKYPEALEAFEEATKSLLQFGGKLPRAQKVRLERDLLAMKTECLSLKDSSTENGKTPLDVKNTSDKCLNENSEIHGAIRDLGLKQKESCGRYVIAVRDVKAGEVLFQEKPFASVLLPEHYATHCHNCHAEFVVPIPCFKCTQSRYCSDVCRKSAWISYHQFECGSLELLNSIGVAHLAERTLIMNSLQSLIQLRPFLSRGLTVDKGVAQEVVNQDYCSILNLVEWANSMDAEDIFQYSVTAILLTMFLDHRTHYFNHLKKPTCDSSSSSSYNSGKDRPSSVNDEFLVFVSTLLLKHICQLVCNASAIYHVGEAKASMAEIGDEQVSQVYTERQIRVATAIYPGASMMNHSCNPSVINSFERDVIVVRAIKNVSKGHEVFNCYGPHYRRQSRAERQRVLRAQYNFDCSCSSCQDDEHEARMVKFTSLKCSKCGGPIPVGTFTDDEYDCDDESAFASPSHSLACLDCGLVQEYTDQIDAIFSSNDWMSQGQDFMQDLNAKDAIRCFKECLQLRESALYKQNRDIFEVKDQLARALAMNGDYEKSAECLYDCITNVELRFGSESIELAHELLKLADILELRDNDHDLMATRNELKLNPELRNILERARLLFVMHYGDQNQFVKSVDDKLNASS